MANISIPICDLPPEQQAIRAKCFHPTGRFVEFEREEIEQSIPDRFEQQVRKYPDRLAVKSRNYKFTYDALNRWANRVAHAILAQRGDGSEPVVLLLEKGAPSITTILAVLKAGKIYVPLDPSHPPTNLSSMLEDSQAGMIVTNNKNVSAADRLAQNKVQLLNIDEIDPRLSSNNIGLPISPDGFAWILYTSGSTGQPKGVVQNHRNVLHVIMNHTNNFHISADDRLSLLYSCSSSASVKNIFGALLNGASLLPFDLQEEGLAHLARWIVREDITIYHSIESVFRHFSSTLSGNERFPALRMIYVGSEPLATKDVELFRAHFVPECILVNVLATGETGPIRQYFINKATEIPGNSVPVGHAVNGMDVSLLNEDGEKIGFDQIGEIVVKSRFLSPGYWRRPDLTEVAFLADPEGGQERIYRTGDLGLMRPDGCLEHLGRKDFQVKVRGHRVEMDEIEAALLDLPAIKEAVVVARENQSEHKLLVAYLVPARQPAPNVSHLRSFLKKKLPDYMIPSAFVMLEAMPLTPSGKVDQWALPLPGRSRPKLDTQFVAPRTPVEEELAEIWAKVVGVDQVGIQDNFFDLGGHSLLATLVISRVINAFKVELPIKFLFESPTVANMAVVITENMAKNAGDEELARMLAELESISDEEARKQLADEEAKEASEK